MMGKTHKINFFTFVVLSIVVYVRLKRKQIDIGID